MVSSANALIVEAAVSPDAGSAVMADAASGIAVFSAGTGLRSTAAEAGASVAAGLAAGWTTGLSVFSSVGTVACFSRGFSVGAG